jgi:hypothetical protein
MKRYKLAYTGNFWDWLIWNIFLSIVTVFTLGFGGVYQAYWNATYVIRNLALDVSDEEEK